MAGGDPEIRYPIRLKNVRVAYPHIRKPRPRYGPTTLYQMIGHFEDYCAAVRLGDSARAVRLAYCFPTFPETLALVKRR